MFSESDLNGWAGFLNDEDDMIEGITRVQDMMDKQLEIIKALFRAHNRLVTELTEHVKFAAEVGVKHVDSETLLNLLQNRNNDIREITKKL
jgi:putative salt-induced outer membrane protein YdiY